MARGLTESHWASLCTGRPWRISSLRISHPRITLGHGASCGDGRIGAHYPYERPEADPAAVQQRAEGLRRLSSGVQSQGAIVKQIHRRMERMTEGKDLPVCKFGTSVISD
ncbi:MAG TPA: hypothetical protein VIW47_05775, partial [Nitrospiraceae bacterium]